MARSKRSRAAEFSKKERDAIVTRDRGNCIFCAMGYEIERVSEYEKSIKEIMHYIPRSIGGLGIRQNGAVGCKGHHVMFDNGNGFHDDMKQKFRSYLQAMYQGWDEKQLVYNKWKELEGKK